MKRLLLITVIFSGIVFAQFRAPRVEDVYGGRILDISAYAKNSDTTRYFISTQSANSVFYTDVYSNTSSPAVNTWTVMPGVNANSGYGSGVRRIEAHEGSGNVIFMNNDGIYSSSPNSTVVHTIHSGFSQEMCLDGDYLFFQDATQLRFGEINTIGIFTENPSSPLALSLPVGNAIYYINPSTNVLYLFYGGMTPTLLKLDAALSSTSVPSSSIDISPTLTSINVNWQTFGIAPDGRLFIFGNDGLDRYVAYSDDETTWTEYLIGGIEGVFGPDVAFSGSAGNYYVYTSSIYSDFKGESGTWHRFGESGFETHANDGSVYVDPINDAFVMMTTDQGIGASDNNGENIYEIDDGVEAVQVFDFDMTDSEYTGWLASKSGIRKVGDFKTSPVWSTAMFPSGDGSPYYSVAIDKFDSTVIYAGNVRVYKSDNDGSSWRQVFSPEVSPYNFPSVGTMCNALESFPYEPNIIFAGFEITDEAKGGLFYSTDSGATWQQIFIETSSEGEDVDVTDIIFNIEGSDTVAYVTVKYDLSLPQGYSIYRIVKNGDTWTPSQDMQAGGTSTGSVIVVTLYDVEISVTGDTVYAAGTDAGVNEPHVYYKPVTATGLWTPITTDGFSSPNGVASAITVGGDTVFAAVNNDVYFYVPGTSTRWNLLYSYPNGTEINVLYYDDLLVGTGLGLYNHVSDSPTSIGNETEEKVTSLILEQNYPNPFNPATTIKYSIPSVIASERSERGNLSNNSQNQQIVHGILRTTNLTSSNSRNDATVQLIVYDILGRKIATLVNEKQSPGEYSVQFDASNLPSGIYFYTLKYGNMQQTKKMILLK